MVLKMWLKGSHSSPKNDTFSADDLEDRLGSKFLSLRTIFSELLYVQIMKTLRREVG